jgi:hypothetical protein
MGHSSMRGSLEEWQVTEGQEAVAAVGLSRPCPRIECFMAWEKGSRSLLQPDGYVGYLCSLARQAGVPVTVHLIPQENA